MSDSRTDLTVVDVSQVELQRRRQYGPGVWVKNPGVAEFTGLATRRLAKVSFAAGLGTTRPTRVVLMTGPDQTELFMIPVADHLKALEVRYANNRAVINLSKFYTQLHRSVAPNTREFHSVDLVPAPITFEGKEHWALVMPLKHSAVKRTRRTSATAKAQTQESMQQMAASKE